MKPLHSKILSWPLIAENFKMCWYLPALSLLIYFMSGIFPLFTSDEKDNGYLLGNYINQCFHNWSLPFLLLLIFVPLTAAVLMLGFLHNPNRSMAIHAQPFRRATIFHSHVLTGWLLCVLPVLVTALLYLLFMRELPAANFYGSFPAEHAENVYTLSAVLKWFAGSVAVLTFLYGMFVLAGSLTGNSLMQVLICGLFFLAVPVLIWISNAYCDTFLYGYQGMPEVLENIMSWANPILRIIIGWGADIVSFGAVVLYLLLGLCMLILAFFAYSRAKLELVGDAMLFGVIEEFLTWVIAFLGMSTCGFFFYYIDEKKFMMVLGMLFGALITFVITKIIFRRSIKIFTKTALRSLLLFVLFAALFTGVAVYDITGYAKRVPKISEVEAISANVVNLSVLDYSLEEKQKWITDETVIADVIALHQYIIDEKLYLPENATDGALIYDYAGNPAQYGNQILYLTYRLNNGHKFNRSYTIALTEEAVAQIDKIVTSAPYREIYRPAKQLKQAEISFIEVSVYGKDGNPITAEDYHGAYKDIVTSDGAACLIETPTDIQAFIEAADQDFLKRHYVADLQEEISDVKVLCTIHYKNDQKAATASNYVIWPQDTAVRALISKICKAQTAAD